LNEARQRRAHDLFKVGCGEAKTTEPQLSNNPVQEGATLLYRQAIRGRPQSLKLRIRKTEHATIVFPQVPMSMVLESSRGTAGGCLGN
jgi:hypothetical protein